MKNIFYKSSMVYFYLIFIIFQMKKEKTKMMNNRIFLFYIQVLFINIKY
jgi:hypothetical protein